MKNKEKKKIIIWISSITGNTKSIACLLIQRLLEKDFQPLVCFSSARMTEELNRQFGLTNEAGEYESDDFPGDWSDHRQATSEKPPVIFCFWCRRGSMDDCSLDFLRKLQGYRILVFGTMGSYPDSEYGQSVHATVSQLVKKENDLEGVFLCRGKIDEKRTSRRRKLPPSHPHYLDDTGYARHLSSQSHPD